MLCAQVDREHVENLRQDIMMEVSLPFVVETGAGELIDSFILTN